MKKAKKVKKTNDDFSVLLSVYYKEKPEYLDLALDSITEKQTLMPSEVVIVKDGPLTDDLEKVLNKYKEKYPEIINFVPLEKNSGLGTALQIGLEHCKYDIVMRMDTDDVACPDRFKKQIAFMKKHPDVSIVGGVIGEFNSSPDEELRIKSMPLSFEDVYKYSKFRNPLNHMTVCFRKKDILEVGNYQPMLYLEDHYLWSRMLVAGKKIENMPDMLVKVRIGNGFYERRGSKNYLKGWKQLQKYLYKEKFITYPQKIRNSLGMKVIVYSPSWLRKVLYNKILRKDI